MVQGLWLMVLFTTSTVSVWLILRTSVSNTEASTNPEVLAPVLPGFSDDELFQFIMIHQ